MDAPTIVEVVRRNPAEDEDSITAVGEHLREESQEEALANT
jgi:hypothetical protein